MNRLLNAGFYRLKRNKVFVICLAGVLSYCIFVNITQYFNELKYGDEGGFIVDPLIFNFLTLIGVVFSVFISLYVGTEYSDGTIRNKLIVGKSRTEVYISNLIICISGGIIITVSAFILGMALGIPLFGTPKMGIPQLALMMFNGVCIGIAYASIFNMIAMINSSKTNSAVVCILVAFVLVFAAIIVFAQLSAPEFIDNWVMVDGETVLEKVKNTKYLTGIKRDIYQNILEIMPSGQAIQIVNNSVINPVKQLVYCGLITVVSNVVGVSIFKRKDLK